DWGVPRADAAGTTKIGFLNARQRRAFKKSIFIIIAGYRAKPCTQQLLSIASKDYASYLDTSTEIACMISSISKVIEKTCLNLNKTKDWS
ncbi:MAG: hypothetical protein ACK5C4_02865, partial [Pseudanabaena sp.]